MQPTHPVHRHHSNTRVCFCLAILVLTTAMSAQSGNASTSAPISFQVADDVPVTAADQNVGLARNTPMLVVDPTDSSVLAQAARIDAPSYGCELDVSGDGGRSWVGTDAFRSLPLGTEACYNPQVAFDRRGRLYLLFVGLRTAGNVPMAAFLTSSTDKGADFARPRQVLGPYAFGVRMILDTSVGEQGRIHIVWVQAGAAPGVGAMPSSANPIMAMHSDDGGKTFSGPVTVSNPARRRVMAPTVALGPGGALAVLYYDLGDDERDYQGLDGPVWDGNWALVLAGSSDGGSTFSEWGVPESGVVPAERVQLIFTMPAAALAIDPSGPIFVAWHDGRNGDNDVFLRRSTDRGASWSSPSRLNDDAPAGLTDQYLPSMALAPDGRLDVAFYDRRNDRDNVYNDVYLVSSSDSGESFSPNVRLNRTSSNSRVGRRYPMAHTQGLVDFGGRPAVVPDDEGATVAWADTRFADPISVGQFTGPTAQDIFATRVTIGEQP